ncbi:hypothetical protein WJX81_006520 [Elliptochloris bilobata]|uniref:Uncharacterized protein n=1 Tax=Elliptochloris bilobata TaxID=381761 RepID=A0AAW1RN54_9CHLO
MTSDSCTPRLAQLRTQMSTELKWALTGVDSAELAKCMPEVPKAQLHTVLDLYRQVLHQLQAHSEAELQEICHEAQLDEKLAQLDQLVSEQCLDAGESRGVQQAAAPAAAARAARVQAKRAYATDVARQLAEARERETALGAAVEAKRTETERAARDWSRLPAELAPAHASSLEWMARPPTAA